MPLQVFLVTHRALMSLGNVCVWSVGEAGNTVRRMAQAKVGVEQSMGKSARALVGESPALVTVDTRLAPSPDSDGPGLTPSLAVSLLLSSFSFFAWNK